MKTYLTENVLTRDPGGSTMVIPEAKSRKLRLCKNINNEDVFLECRVGDEDYAIIAVLSGTALLIGKKNCAKFGIHTSPWITER